MSTSAIFSLLIQLVICHVTLGCDDVSESACKQFAVHYPNLCEDGCLSSLCARTCNRCELKCFSCFDINDSTLCNETVRCPSLDHHCILVKSYDNNFRRVYKLGCAVGDVCDNPWPDTSCCDTDLCNDHFYRSATTTPPSTTTTAPLPGVVLVGRRQTADPQCEEALPSACADIVAADPSVCSKDCLYKRCPVACGHCKTCYSCDFVQDPRMCNTTTVCEQGEVCYGLEAINAFRQHGFRFGCTPKLLCGQISSVSTNAFGKRESSLAGGCCNDSLCNDNLKPVSTQPPSTTATTISTSTTAKITTALLTTEGVTTHNPNCHCPGGRWSFYANNRCYFFDQTAFLTKNQTKEAMIYPNPCKNKSGLRPYISSNMMISNSHSQAWCDARCGRLVDVRNGAELLSVTNVVYKTIVHNMGPHSTHSAYMRTHFFLDAMYVSGRGWVWETSRQPVPGDVVGGVVAATSGACAVAKGHNSGVLMASGCNDRRYVVCVLK